MANRRSVDPTAVEASSIIIGIRMTATQVTQIEEMSNRKGVQRSTFIRNVLCETYAHYKGDHPHLETENRRLSEELARTYV